MTEVINIDRGYKHSQNSSSYFMLFSFPQVTLAVPVRQEDPVRQVDQEDPDRQGPPGGQETRGVMECQVGCLLLCLSYDNYSMIIVTKHNGK